METLGVQVKKIGNCRVEFHKHTEDADYERDGLKTHVWMLQEQQQYLDARSQSQAKISRLGTDNAAAIDSLKWLRDTSHVKMFKWHVNVVVCEVSRQRAIYIRNSRRQWILILPNRSFVSASTQQNVTKVLLAPFYTVHAASDVPPPITVHTICIYHPSSAKFDRAEVRFDSRDGALPRLG